jgi:hypothetical protein
MFSGRIGDVTMAIRMRRVKTLLKWNKEGLLVGAILGAVFAFYIKNKGIDLMFAVEKPGLIDYMVSIAPVDMAFLKVLITFTVIGATLGFVADMLIKPRQ